MTGYEAFLEHVVRWLILAVETVGITIITIGVVIAIASLVRHPLGFTDRSFNHIRLKFARYLALALEFQLAADILGTTIAPTWEEIGKLGAVAVIRTGLNFFLAKEMEHEARHRGQENPEDPPPDDAPDPAGEPA